MINRREFVQLSGVGAAVLSSGVLAMPGGKPCLFVVDDGVSESHSFCPSGHERSRLKFALSQPQAGIDRIRNALVKDNRVFGATRESHAFVVDQLLRDTPFELRMLARHAISADGTTQHSTFVDVDDGTAHELLAPANWAQCWSTALFDVRDQIQFTDKEKSVDGRQQQLPSKRIELVSWTFGRIG